MSTNAAKHIRATGEPQAVEITDPIVNVLSSTIGVIFMIEMSDHL